MPVSWDISCEQALATVRLEGHVDLSATIEAIVAVSGSPDFSPRYRVLVDLRDMEYTPALKEVLEIGSALGVTRRLFQNKIAVVAGSAVHFRMAQIVTALAVASGLRQKVFREIENAEGWLRSEDD